MFSDMAKGKNCTKTIRVLPSTFVVDLPENQHQYLVKTIYLISKIHQKLRHLPRRQLIVQNTIGCSRPMDNSGQMQALTILVAKLQPLVNGCSLHWHAALTT